MEIVQRTEIFDARWKKFEDLEGMGLNLKPEWNLAYTGNMSIGCKGCTFYNHRSYPLNLGVDCNCDCPFCFRVKEARYAGEEHEEILYKELQELSKDPDFRPEYISFNSQGEPALYLDRYMRFVDILKEIEEKHGYKAYKHFYTNGMLLDDDKLDTLKAMGVHEIRFHLSAAMYSKGGSKQAAKGLKDALMNIYKAKTKGFSVTVEEPMIPEHRKFLFSILPTLHNMDVDHLNMVEFRIYETNVERIKKHYDHCRAYTNGGLFYIDDDGLVFDIFREAIIKKYSFSAMFCNSGMGSVFDINLLIDDTGIDNGYVRGC